MATLVGRKRSRAMSHTPSDEELEFPPTGQPDRHQIKLETGSAMASDGVDEQLAVQLLLLLRSSPSTTSSEDDSETGSDDGREYAGQDLHHNGLRPAHDAERPNVTTGQTPTTAVRRSGRTRRVVGMEDYVWGEGDEAYLNESAMMDEDEQDGSDESTNKSEDHNEEEDKNEDGGRQENEDGDEEEEDDEEEPEEEDFSEGDEYVEPPSSSSSRRTRSLRNRARRPSSPPYSVAPTAHYHSVANSAAASHSVTSGEQPPELMIKILPISASANHAPSSPGQPPATLSSVSSAMRPTHDHHEPISPPLAAAEPNGAKKTRKPKYSAALEARWEEKFEWLLTYRRAKGNCRVAEGNKEYPGLGKWLSNQKTLCKKGKLKADRRQRLIDVGAIADPSAKTSSSSSLSSSAPAATMGGAHMSSPPSSPLSASSSSASPYLTMSSQPQQQKQKPERSMEDEEDEDAQGPISKRRRRSHFPQLTVDVDRLPSMGSSDQEVDSAASSPSGPLTAPPIGLFSASSPFRTFQGKPILPSLTFPHPMTHGAGGLHAHLPPQQPQLQNGGASAGSSFLSFALTSMPALFSPYPILGNPTSSNLTGPHHALPL